MLENILEWIGSYPNFFVIFLSIGSIGLLWHLLTFGKALTCVVWPSTQGRIENSSVADMAGGNTEGG
jgi:hypothetical protein